MTTTDNAKKEKLSDDACLSTEDIKTLLHIIDEEARKVCEIEYGLPLYSEKEELFVKAVQEFIGKRFKG